MKLHRRQFKVCFHCLAMNFQGYLLYNVLPLRLGVVAREGETLLHLAQMVQSAVSNLARRGLRPSVE